MQTPPTQLRGCICGFCGFFEVIDPREHRQRARQHALVCPASPLPKLLEACKAVDEWHDLVKHCYPTWYDVAKQDCPEMLPAFKKVRAAIAEAEGGDS